MNQRSLCKGCRHKKNEMIASIIKIITSHFAISIEKPATPRAPSIYAINANIRKATASPIKSGIFHSPSEYLANKLIIRLKVFIIWLSN